MNATSKPYLALATCSLALTFSGTVMAAGFQINEHGAAATARGGAVFATISDPSAVFYNPAGLTRTSGTHLSLGVTGVLPSAFYEGPGLPSTRPEGITGDVKQEGVSEWVPLPNFYASHALSDKAHVGMGVYAPYGLGIAWKNPEEFVGRTVLHEQTLRTLFITPLAIALKLSDKVSVGVKVSLVPASVYLKRTVGATDNGQVLFPKSDFGSEGTAELAAEAFGVGFGLGTQLQLTDELSLGFAYRSAVTLDFAGQVDFQIPETAPASVAAQFPDGDIQGLLTLPHSFAGGLAWNFGKLSVEAGVNLTLWQSYDELRILFTSGKPSDATVSPKNWEPALTYRLGGTYDFSSLVDGLAAHIGAVYDETPVPEATLDPSLPDADRLIGTTGISYKWGPISTDIAYMAIVVQERETEGNANFQTPAKYPGRLINLASISLGYTF